MISTCFHVNLENIGVLNTIAWYVFGNALEMQMYFKQRDKEKGEKVFKN
jgi:hypothetical protein